jgi:hypothetical protein
VIHRDTRLLAVVAELTRLHAFADDDVPGFHLLAQNWKAVVFQLRIVGLAAACACGGHDAEALDV